MAEAPQLVLIEWVDSGQPIPGWQWLSDLDPRRAHKCVSVGFLVQDDEKTKVLAANLGASSGDEDWDQASGLITIPAVAITKLERLTSSSISSAYFGHLTNDIVWARLAPGVLEEMQTIVPKRNNGKGRKYPFTRRLTEDVGHPKMREHLASVTTIMKLSDEYEDFVVKLDRVHPRFDETLALPLFDKDGDPV